MVTTYKYEHELLQTSNNDLQALIAVTGSKSETNRLLLLQALFPTIAL
jgi:3-phosphoshikimate 1-carboxyvinyltransferase